MIQRFNFYDVYGYLVPGVVLLALFWLPSGLVSGRWPSVDWSSALVGLVFAYVAGHVLQSLARPALPSTDPQPSDSPAPAADTLHGAKALSSPRPQPSDFLLDAYDTTLSRELKDRLYHLIEKQFHIDVRRGSADDKNLKALRQDAFLLCRIALIRSGAASYAV